MNNEKMINLVRKQLDANKLENAEVYVTDIWSCDMDSDGKQEIFLRACNASDKTEERKYHLLLYVQGEEAQTVYSHYTDSGTKMNERIVPMICDLNGDKKWSLLLYKDGDYESFISFDYNKGNFAKSYEIIF